MALIPLSAHPPYGQGEGEIRTQTRELPRQEGGKLPARRPAPFPFWVSKYSEIAPDAMARLLIGSQPDSPVAIVEGAAAVMKLSLRLKPPQGLPHTNQDVRLNLQ